RHGTKNCSAFFAAKEPPRASHCGVSSRLLVLQESPCFSIAKYEQKNPIIKENDNWIFDWFCPSMFFIKGIIIFVLFFRIKDNGLVNENIKMGYRYETYSLCPKCCL